MNIPRLLKAIAGSPGSESDFGTLNEDAENALDAINTELIKRGTLSAEDIDWKAIEAATLGLFTHCVHLYGYVAAVLLIARIPSQGHLNHTIKVMEHFLDHSWPGLHPNGPRAERHKNKFLGELIAAFTGHITAVVNAERTLSQECHKGLKSLVKRLEKLKLPVDLKELRSAMDAAKAPKLVDETAFSSDGSFKKRELDAKERAEMRRAIKSMADQIFQYDPDAGVSFALRGYAAWLEHWQESPSEGGMIEQYPMPANIQDEHAKAALKPNLSTVMRLEDRLFNSPDWMEGQKTLYGMLMTLEFPHAAQAVRQRVAHRLSVREELKSLKYANGTDIVPPEIESWAAATPIESFSVEGADEGGEEENPAERMLEALTALDKELAHSLSGRAVFTKRLEFAEELLTAGLKAQTLSILTALEMEVEQKDLKDWDPEFFQRLKTLKERSLSK